MSAALNIRRLAAAAALAALGLATPPAQAATSCSASMTNVVFAPSDPFAGWTDVTATLNYSCSTGGLSLLATAAVRLCFSIGSGTQGTGSLSPRRMLKLDSSSELQFNLYKDAARTQVWGLYPTDHASATLSYSVPLLGGSGNGSLTAYARVPSNQLTVTPGSYQNNFSGTDAQMTYRYDEVLLGTATVPASCASGGDGGGSSSFPFSATTDVQSACNPVFSTQNVDFGTHGLLTGSLDVNATVGPQCTNTTPYQIGLDDGQNAVGNTRRMRSAAGNYVTYELYRDAGRSQRWGDTENVDTIGETGNGSAQNRSIYGRVAPQTTPPQGSYSDTVTVTLTY